MFAMRLGCRAVFATRQRHQADKKVDPDSSGSWAAPNDCGGLARRARAPLATTGRACAGLLACWSHDPAILDPIGGCSSSREIAVSDQVFPLLLVAREQLEQPRRRAAEYVVLCLLRLERHDRRSCLADRNPNV